jgi:hypothetical protein
MSVSGSSKVASSIFSPRAASGQEQSIRQSFESNRSNTTTIFEEHQGERMERTDTAAPLSSCTVQESNVRNGSQASFEKSISAETEVGNHGNPARTFKPPFPWPAGLRLPEKPNIHKMRERDLNANVIEGSGDTKLRAVPHMLRPMNASNPTTNRRAWLGKGTAWIGRGWNRCRSIITDNDSGRST